MSPAQTQEAQNLGKHLARKNVKRDELVEFVKGRQHGYVLRSAYDKEVLKIKRSCER